jgi:hypothetical protein
MIGLELEGAATDVGGIDDPGLEAKIFGNAKAANALIAARVVHGIDIGPVKTRIFESFRGRFGLDL